MSTIFENKQRRVIPNFRSLKKTVELGELDANKNVLDPFVKDDLESYYKDFSEDKSIGTAGDLISAAIVNNIFNPIVSDAAQFILNNKKESSSVQIQIAEKILDIGDNKIRPNIETIDELLELSNRPLIHNRIRKIKSLGKYFDHNPFLYCELSRLYSIIGQKESAIKNIKVAIGLAPNNRYILRSYARLMSHFGYIDSAHDILRKNIATKHDPWLLASEIAFASLRDKTSNFIKAGNEIIASNNFSPFSISELASSIGSVELTNGRRKRSKQLLESALIQPNDNSLAQVEWINNKEEFFDLDIKRFNVELNYEALTLESYNAKDWKKAIENAEKWFIDMPFAKRPIMYAHHAASFFLQDYDTAIKFCKVGLISNPNDPQIINNIAFSLAMNNETTQAFEYLNKINISTVNDDPTRICLLATSGLAYYRSGFPELGKRLYIQAMEYANKKKLPYYYYMALLNLAREEISIKSDISQNLYEQVLKINEESDEDLKFLKYQVKNRILQLDEQRLLGHKQHR